MGKMRRAGSMSRTAFSVSVAMAAYNGAPFIGNQIETILSQLKEGDELIISLDPSSDNTEEIIRAFAKRGTEISFIHREAGMLYRSF